MTGTALIAPSLVTEQERRDMLVEAEVHLPTASRSDRSNWKIVDGRQLLGPARFSYSLRGDIRQQVQRRVADRAAKLVDVPVQPIQSNYLYYFRGDYLGLHHDQARCPLSAIVLLGGDAGPLCVHSEPRAISIEQFSDFDPTVEHEGSRFMLQQGPLLLWGGLLPHHRDPHTAVRPAIIVTFCLGIEGQSSP